jgi:hypothetical protein
VAETEGIVFRGLPTLTQNECGIGLTSKVSATETSSGGVSANEADKTSRSRERRPSRPFVGAKNHRDERVREQA